MATIKHTTGNRAMPPGRTSRRGFTLAEMIIALGILGVGLTMASALFPTAIKQDAITFQDTIGSMIAQNGLAVAKASWRHYLPDPATPTIPNPLNPNVILASQGYKGVFANNTIKVTGQTWLPQQWRGFYVFVDNNDTNDAHPFYQVTDNTADTLTLASKPPVPPSGLFWPLGYQEVADHQYPVLGGNPPSPYQPPARGSIILGKVLNNDSATYQLISIAYQQFKAGDYVAPMPMYVTHPYPKATDVPTMNDDATLTIDALGTPISSVVMGSPVIDMITGLYATVAGIDDAKGTVMLSHPLMDLESSGTVQANGAILDTKFNWTPNQWQGRILRVYDSTGKRLYEASLLSNSANQLTIDSKTWGNIPAGGGTYTYRIMPYLVLAITVREENVNYRSPAINVLVTQTSLATKAK